MTRKATAETGDGFAPLGLDARLVKELAALGYEEPTPIQREAIPPLLEGRDLVGQAATGTGKTAAFALPLLQRLGDRGGRGPAAMILCPTRELATQVAEAVHRYGRPLKTSVLPVFGGQAYGPQIRALERGVDVVIATPGRALDLIRRGTLKLDVVSVVVLDEADEMLDMGFAEDIEAILGGLPKGRQTVLFSATMPPKIAGIAKRHLTNPVTIKIAAEPVAAGDAPFVRQTAYLVPRAHKLSALGRVLDMENPTSAIVFCRRRNEVDELAEALNARGYRAEGLHGGMTQEQRNRVMKKFRAGGSDLLIATDVAARGLDIEHLSHVVNYDVPAEAESYVHRIGRVGRAGREGVAITLAEPREHRQIRSIEGMTKGRIEVAKLPTVADLRSRRLEITQATVRDAILAGELDGFRVVAETLAEEFDVLDVTMAALKLLHQAGAGEGDEEADEIPQSFPVREEFERPGRRGRGPRADGPPRGRDRNRDDERPARLQGPRADGKGVGMARLFLSAGRIAGIRPQDLVGAITGEAGISGRQVGTIDIADRHTFVEIDEDVADLVVLALRNCKIKGKKVMVRRDDGSR